MGRGEEVGGGVQGVDQPHAEIEQAAALQFGTYIGGGHKHEEQQTDGLGQYIRRSQTSRRRRALPRSDHKGHQPENKGLRINQFFSVAITPSYTSSVTFAITTKNASGTTIGNVSVTDTIVEQFGEVLSSDLVCDAAAKRMGLESFPSSITTEAPKNTNILVMNVTADSPELAYKSALALMDSHGEYSRKVFTMAYLDNINGPTVAVTANNSATRATLLKLSAPIGAFLVILLLVMMAIQADTIQTTDGAKQQVDGKLLATIYHEKKYPTLRAFLKKTKQALLITNPTCSFYYTETMHQLRVRLEHAKERKGCKIFTVTSCSENEGKSTVAANIALSLAQKHHRVLLVDADLRKPAQNLIFQTTPDPNANFGHFLTKGFTSEAPVPGKWPEPTESAAADHRTK